MDAGAGQRGCLETALMQVPEGVKDSGLWFGVGDRGQGLERQRVSHVDCRQAPPPQQYPGQGIGNGERQRPGLASCRADTWTRSQEAAKEANCCSYSVFLLKAPFPQGTVLSPLLGLQRAPARELAM